MPRTLRTGFVARRDGNEQQTARRPLHWEHFSLRRTMTVRLIQNGREYREARQTLLDLVGLDPAPATPEDDQLLALASAIERYELRHVLDLPAGARRTMVAKHGGSTDDFWSHRFLQPEWERRRL